jgi:hypothetical protein
MHFWGNAFSIFGVIKSMPSAFFSYLRVIFHLLFPLV